MRTTARVMSLAIALGLFAIPLPRDVAAADCRQAINLAANHLLQHVRVLAIGRIKYQYPRIPREPLAKRQKNQVRRTGPGQNAVVVHAACLRDSRDQPLASGRR